ncbi:hypothetical protein LTS15_008376 [Exophiala xenobiotica]|nr:hypothetical protein LTS15_008376 [Exophiala xenobiotica]
MPSLPFTREEPVLAHGHGEQHSLVEDRQYQAGAPDRDQVVANISPQHHQTFPSLSLRRHKTLTLEDELFVVNPSTSTRTFFNPSESIIGPIDPDINCGHGTGASSAVSESNSHKQLDYDGHVQPEEDAEEKEEEEEADDRDANLIDDHDHTVFPFLHRRKTLEDELSAVGMGVGVGGNDLMTDLDFDGSTLIDNEADCNEHEQWQQMKIGVVSSALACDGDGDDNQQLLNDTSSEVTMTRTGTSLEEEEEEDDDHRDCSGSGSTTSSVLLISNESNNMTKNTHTHTHTHIHTHLTSTVPDLGLDLDLTRTAPASAPHAHHNRNPLPLARPSPTTPFLALNQADLLSWHAHLTSLSSSSSSCSSSHLLPPTPTPTPTTHTPHVVALATATATATATHADALYRWILSSALPYIAAMERYTHTIAEDNEKLMAHLESLRRQVEELSACYEKEVDANEKKSRVLDEVGDMLGTAAAAAAAGCVSE